MKRKNLNKEIVRLSEEPKICIKVVSDIHLEFIPGNTFDINPPTVGPSEVEGITTCCILAGDIGHPTAPYYEAFLGKVKEIFDHVIVVAGNHEYYKEDGEYIKMEQVEIKIRSVCDELGCHFLQKNSVEIEGIKFIGATYWSKIPKLVRYDIAMGINDYSQILVDDSKLTTRMSNELYTDHKKYIKKEVGSSVDEKIIVVTHHAPVWEMVQEKYEDSIFTFAFANRDNDMMKKQIKLWVNGHLHNSKQVYVGDTLCLSNCRGYSSSGLKSKDENPMYNPNLEILI